MQGNPEFQTLDSWADVDLVTARGRAHVTLVFVIEEAIPQVLDPRVARHRPKQDVGIQQWLMPFTDGD